MIQNTSTEDQRELEQYLKTGLINENYLQSIYIRSFSNLTPLKEIITNSIEKYDPGKRS